MQQQYEEPLNVRGGSILNKPADEDAERRVRSNYRYKAAAREYSRQPSGHLATSKTKGSRDGENSAQLELILEDLNKYQ